MFRNKYGHFHFSEVSIFLPVVFFCTALISFSSHILCHSDFLACLIRPTLCYPKAVVPKLGQNAEMYSLLTVMHLTFNQTCFLYKCKDVLHYTQQNSSQVMP